MATKVTFGADPEFFVARKEKPTVPVPACGLFGGMKKAPVFLTPEGGYLEDGCAVEFNVNPNASLVEVRKSLDRLITAFLTLNKDYVICPVASAIFDQKELRAHPQASVLGCDADFWAYGLRVKPQVSMFKNRRFAGGHIHIGLDPWPKDLDPKVFMKAIDVFVWPSFAGTYGVDPHRYEFYGHPGLYRETSYGIEWRSPDNSWALPRADKDQDASYEMAVQGMEGRIKSIIQDIETVGPEKYNLRLHEFISYIGMEPLLKSKSFAKVGVISARLQEYQQTWQRFMVKGLG
jgi:hypothetical protein